MGWWGCRGRCHAGKFAVSYKHHGQPCSNCAVGTVSETSARACAHLLLKVWASVMLPASVGEVTPQVSLGFGVRVNALVAEGVAWVMLPALVGEVTQ